MVIQWDPSDLVHRESPPTLVTLHSIDNMLCLIIRFFSFFRAPRPRPRTAFPRTDTLEAKDRNARGQGPRTQAQVLSKNQKKGLHKNFSGNQKKKVFAKIFQAISTKKRFPKNFSSIPQNFNNSKNPAVLEPRTGQFSRT